MSVPPAPYGWGTTADDLALRFACDPPPFEPTYTVWRAIDLDAPAAVTFAWLAQLRRARYAYDFAPARRDLRRGPPRAGERALLVAHVIEVEPGRALTLRMTHPLARAVFGDLIGTYVAVPRGARAARIVAKVHVRLGGGYGRTVRGIMPWLDWLMFRAQLRTLRRYAEREARGD